MPRKHLIEARTEALEEGMNTENGQIQRTKELGYGQLVEELHCHATDKRLSDVERQDIIEWALRFEECTSTEDELNALKDADLIRDAYWIMAEYASGQMNIRQAARWAERNQCMSRVNRSTGEREFLYAVYDTGTHMVHVLGSYDKCKAAMPPPGQPAQDGRWLRMEALDTIVAELDESDAEALCIPDACEVREWA